MAIVGVSQRYLLVMFVLIGLALHREATPSWNTKEEGNPEQTPGLPGGQRPDTQEELDSHSSGQYAGTAPGGEGRDEGSGQTLEETRLDGDLRATHHGVKSNGSFSSTNQSHIGYITDEEVDNELLSETRAKPDDKLYIYNNRKHSVEYTKKRSHRASYGTSESVILPATNKRESTQSLTPHPSGVPTSQIPLLEGSIQLRLGKVGGPTRSPEAEVTSEILPAVVRAEGGGGGPTPTVKGVTPRNLPTSYTPPPDPVGNGVVTVTEDTTPDSLMDVTTDTYAYHESSSDVLKGGSDSASSSGSLYSQANGTKLKRVRRLKVRTGVGDTLPQDEFPQHDGRQRGRAKTGVKTLHIGGLFELTDSAGSTSGPSELAAARLAVNHINRQKFVPGFKLQLVQNDTKCDPGYGADAFYDLVYRKPTMMMLIGSSCSEVTKTLAEIVPYWNLVQISYGATSPALSKREKYPTFYRLAAADSSHNAARKTFIQYFGWDTVAILHQDLETFSLAVNDMHATFNKVNISVVATQTFRGMGNDLRVKMLELNRTDARIIIGSFQEDAARQVFCEAYRLGMYGARYVWMLVGWYTEHWWGTGATAGCTPDQLARAVDGYFSVDTLNAIIGNRRSLSGLTTEEFLNEYTRRHLPEPRSSYAQVTYDTVWTVALTLRKTVEEWQVDKVNRRSLDMFSYNTGTQMAHQFFRIMGSLEFMGVSGPVSFDGPDRRGISVLEQNQGGEIQRIALFYPENNTLDFNCPGCGAIHWKGGKVPADKYTILTRQQHIEQGAFYTVCASSSVGILVASFFLGFNLYHRKLKYIKLSSPKLNNVAVIGCIHVYVAVILLGFDDASLDTRYFPIMCTVRAFLLAAGFSLAFGAMFTKTYRVHQIFTRAHSGLVKSKLLKDKQLLFIVVALLVVDVSIIALWVVIDPMHRSVSNFTSVPSAEDTDLLYIPQLAKCDSAHLDKWLGAFYAYKGLLLLFGVYMAWETRHVKIPVLNDSQYIGMNIYNVVLMSVTVVALSSILTDQPTLSYAIVSALIILSTTGLLGLLFLPKIYAIIKHNGSPIITSAGLTVEANTRRFAVDEKKELYYRAEVQNRVYKRELVELDQEIMRIERLLELPGQQFNHVPDDLMYLLPETKSDITPRARRRKEFIRCDSSTFITDAADVCVDLPEINLSCLEDEKRKLEKQDSGFHTMSFKNSNFMTAEEENPRSGDRLELEAGRLRGDQSPSSPESDAYISPGTKAAPEGGAKYTSLRRQSSTDGDMEEKESLLVGEAEEEGATKGSSIDSATILINKPGIRGQQHKKDSEKYEMHDMSLEGACAPPLPVSTAQAHSTNAPPSIFMGKHPRNVKGHRVVMGDKLTLPKRGSGGTQQVVSPLASHRRTLPESERRRKIQVLQRELARIQKELKSLGEVEIEVSYV